MPIWMRSALSATRRTFLSRVGVVGCLVGRLSTVVAADEARREPSGPIRIDALTREQMQAHVGTTFRLVANARDTIPVHLVDVTALHESRDRSGAAARRAPFSIVFQGPAEPVLTQRTYALQHEMLGTLDLFLVPIGPFKDGMGYEAVLN